MAISIVQNIFLPLYRYMGIMYMFLARQNVFRGDRRVSHFRCSFDSKELQQKIKEKHTN